MLALLSLAHVAFAEVKTLDPKLLEGTLKAEPFALVLFYAPWCSISNQFLPIFEKLEVSDFALGKVDCVKHESLHQKHNISSFPTLKAFIYGHALDYGGSFDEEGIYSFVRRIQMSSSHTLRVDGGYEAFKDSYLTSHRPIAICSSSDIPTLMNFDLACILANSVTCAISENPLLRVADFPFPSIFIQRNFDNEESTIFANDEEAADHNKLKDFLMKNSYPQVLNFTKENEDIIFSSHRPGYTTHILLVGDSNQPKITDMLAGLRRLHSSFWNRCVFIFIDTATESDYLTNILMDIQVPRESTVVMAAKTLVTKVNFFSFNHEISNDFERDIEAWIEMVLDDSAPVLRTTLRA